MDHEAFIQEKERVIDDIKKTIPDLEILKISSSYDPGLSHHIYEQKLSKAKVKEKHISLMASKLFSEYLMQDPESWPSRTDTEPFTEEIGQECKKVFDEMKEKETDISSMCELAEEAFYLLQVKLKEADKEKENLQEKISKLATLKARQKKISVGGAVTSQNVEEKLKRIDGEISKCRTTKVKALTGLQENMKTVNDLQAVVNETKQLVEFKQQLEESQMSDVCHNVERFRKLVEDMESLGGVRAHRIASDSLCLEFLQILVADNINLQLLLEFCDNDFGEPVLTSAKVNEDILNVDDILSRAVKTNDVVNLVEQLQSRWMLHLPLITEINQLREMYAIDWIQDENVLHIIVGKHGTIVCTLAIPAGYPRSGKITPVSISGDVESDETTFIEPEGKGTLLNWAKYLKEKYSNC